MTGLSIDPAKDHFVLRREREDGDKASISLTSLELLTLAEMAPSLHQKAVAMLYPQNKSRLSQIVAMNVFDFQLQPEVLESKLFLMLRLGTTGSSSVAYAFSRSLAVATIGFAARPAGWDRFEIAGIPRQVSFID